MRVPARGDSVEAPAAPSPWTPSTYRDESVSGCGDGVEADAVDARRAMTPFTHRPQEL